MKKTIIIITLAFICFLAKSQEKSFDNIVSFGLPTNIEKPDKQKLQSFMQKRRNSIIDLKNFKGNAYKSADILIITNAGSGKVGNNFLEQSKNFSDELAPQIPTQKNYSSKIISNNNFRSLIIHYDRVDFSYYNIQSVNINNDKTSIIRLEFKKEDEAKAGKIVENILKDLRFK